MAHATTGDTVAVTVLVMRLIRTLNGETGRKIGHIPDLLSLMIAPDYNEAAAAIQAPRAGVTQISVFSIFQLCSVTP